MGLRWKKKPNSLYVDCLVNKGRSVILAFLIVSLVLQHVFWSFEEIIFSGICVANRQSEMLKYGKDNRLEPIEDLLLPLCCGSGLGILLRANAWFLASGRISSTTGSMVGAIPFRITFSQEVSACFIRKKQDQTNLSNYCYIQLPTLTFSQNPDSLMFWE